MGKKHKTNMTFYNWNFCKNMKNPNKKIPF